MLAEEMEVASLLGLNAFQDLIEVPRQTAAALGITQTYLNRWIPHQTFACPTKAENAKIIEDNYRSEAEKLRKDDPETLRNAYRNKLYDEPGTGNLDHIAQCESCTAAFREYLKQRHLAPAEFGKTGWDQVASSRGTRRPTLRRSGCTTGPFSSATLRWPRSSNGARR